MRAGSEVVRIAVEEARRRVAVADVDGVGRGRGVVGPGARVGEDDVVVAQLGREAPEQRGVERQERAVEAGGARHQAKRALADRPSSVGGRQRVEVDEAGEDRRVRVAAPQRLQHPLGAAVLRQVVVDQGHPHHRAAPRLPVDGQAGSRHLDPAGIDRRRPRPLGGEPELFPHVRQHQRSGTGRQRQFARVARCQRLSLGPRALLPPASVASARRTPTPAKNGSSPAVGPVSAGVAEIGAAGSAQRASPSPADSGPPAQR